MIRTILGLLDALPHEYELFLSEFRTSYRYNGRTCVSMDVWLGVSVGNGTLKLRRTTTMSRRLQKLRILAELRRSLRVRRIPRGYVLLYATDCSEKEIERLEHLSIEQFQVAEEYARNLLRTDKAIGCIQVVCIGESTPLESLPIDIRRRCTCGYGPGFWLRSMRFGVASFAAGASIHQIVCHEVAHGLLDSLSSEFPYPLALEEGFTAWLQVVSAGKKRSLFYEHSTTRHQEAMGRFWEASQCPSIYDLLTFERAGSFEQIRTQLTVLTAASLWLVCFLGKLGDPQPVTDQLWFALREQDIRSPDAVYKWLQGVTGMGHQALETKFQTYCTTGVV